MRDHLDKLTYTSFAGAGLASGLILNGVSFFLLIYYGQVLGLSPALVGLAVARRLILDRVALKAGR